MQMSVSKEMENRMDENSSTPARKVRELLWISKPWVETVMADGVWARPENNKKTGLRRPDWFERPDTLC
jgi:hypothetical protein